MNIFKNRSCPACGCWAGETLFNLEAESIARNNWSYRGSYADSLQIAPQQKFPIDKCVSCGFIYARLQPSDAFLRTLYDDVIDAQIAQNASATFVDCARRMRYIAELAALMKQSNTEANRATALDFGCGFGRTARLLSELGYSVVAFEPSAVRIAANAESSTRIDVVSTLEDVMQRAPYSLIIIDNVLEHLPDPRATLNWLTNACSPGATVFVSVPSFEPKIIDRLIRDHQMGSLNNMAVNPWEHLNYFDIASLDRMMAEVGFSPLNKSDLGLRIDVGLRPEKRITSRMLNGLASIKRILDYILHGDTMKTVEERYYKMTRSNR